MKKCRFTECQIVAVLKEGEAGMPVAELCRKHGTSSPTYYRRKSKYSGVQVSELQRLREMEAEKAKLEPTYVYTNLQTKTPIRFQKCPIDKQLDALHKKVL